MGFFFSYLAIILRIPKNGLYCDMNHKFSETGSLWFFLFAGNDKSPISQH